MAFGPKNFQKRLSIFYLDPPFNSNADYRRAQFLPKDNPCLMAIESE